MKLKDVKLLLSNYVSVRLVSNVNTEEVLLLSEGAELKTNKDFDNWKVVMIDYDSSYDQMVVQIGNFDVE